MFTLLAYSEAALAAGATDTDVNAVVDPDFSQRSSHYIFSEDYNVLAACVLEANITRARFNVPKMNTYGRPQIFPINRSATVPSNPNVMDLRDYPMQLPTSEEIALELTNDLGAATEVGNVLLWVAPPTWNRNIPRGIIRQTLRATAAVAGVAQAWSGGGAITLADTVRGGWFAVVGAECFDAGSLAFRLIFPRPPSAGPRKMRPGGLCMEAIGNIPWPPQDAGFGEWGRFHTFELPQVEILANATAASTQELRLDVVYLGDQPYG